MSYAKNTSVAVERSRIEIERVLTKYGAAKFGYMTEPATIYFEFKSRTVQLAVPMPPKTDKRFTHDKRSTWRKVADGERDKRWEAERRRRWRVLLITVKALLEAVESGVLTFDEAFLAHIAVPGTAKTIGQQLVPRLDALYSGLSLPALLAENP